MDLEGVPPPVIEDSSLTGWVSIGSGGFGEIYKARHKGWCSDVAIKLLHNDGGQTHEKRIQALQQEVQMMLLGSSEYVMQVLGVFNGRPPNSGPSAQLGLVMKYMEKGTLESLQKTFDRVLPLPLVFRLAHQVALGINFLHSLSKALLHLDLKPSNVLLDSDLNVKLTDFGLSKPSQTWAQVSKTDKVDGGGTINYMPPEAFDINYKPSRAFDIYSFGILLWSIATGEQPYPHAPPSVVMLLIPRGQRPSLDKLTVRAADQAELSGLMELMIRCWETSPTQRPSSLECTKITEKLYQTQKRGIIDAVHEVLKKLEQKEQDNLTEDLQWLRVTPAKGSLRVEAMNNRDHVLTGPPPVQEVAPGRSPNQRVKDPLASQQANVCDGDSTRSSTGDHEPKASSVQPIGESPAPPSTTRSPQASAAKNPPQPFQEVAPRGDHKPKASSVHPIGESPTPPSTTRSPQASAAKNPQRDFRYPPQPFERQFSSPTPSSTIQPTHNVYIHCSHVTGVQIGNNNTLYINKEPSERRRHPTAPSRVNPPSPHPGSRRN
ncbi:receptor-interacting serine/threonine-protein kinase 3-like [Limanda limanda]|uniref:receptor-interacting serine/threonine-protein kinase 3-like n=1 Tax=Limanda limanda TaxID=27771 RepID=UPI0029C7D152|nr:receptor-interacting serine/threonine-protein kinase 3-like [Limanda limanda]